METIITAATIFAMYANVAVMDGSKYCYNADLENGQVTTLYVYDKVGELLRQRLEYKYEYDEEGRLVTRETLRWDIESQEWRRENCLCFSYNEAGYSVEHCQWNKALQAYNEADEMAVYHYEFDGLLSVNYMKRTNDSDTMDVIDSMLLMNPKNDLLLATNILSLGAAN